jgi:hypothetical protein
MNRMNKPGAWQAWKMLVLSLPKGLLAFVTAAAGLSVSLPLSVFLIGLPLLAETFVLCARMMEAERRKVEAWKRGAKRSHEPAAEPQTELEWAGWRKLFVVLGQGRSYRAVVYALLELPIGIAAFVAAIVLPVTAWAVLLSPLANQISTKYYSFELFAGDVVTRQWFPDWTGYERSWLYAGAGALLLLLIPFLLRVMGRMYTRWVVAISGTGGRNAAQPAAVAAPSA